MEKEEGFFSKLKDKYHSDSEIERTKEIIKLFVIEKGEYLNRILCENDVILLADIFQKLVIVSYKEFDFILLYCVSVPGSIYQCEMKYTGINLQTLQDKVIILLVENKIRAGKNCGRGVRYVKLD